MYKRFAEVRVYRRSIGRRCMHCHKPATVTAWCVAGKTRTSALRHPVRYCSDHAIQLGAIKKKESSE